MSKEIEKELLEEELDLGAETEDLVPDSVDMTCLLYTSDAADD